MRCIICKKGCEETDLYEGILEDGMVMVCASCAEIEGIPLIRKPSARQLEKADERYSVRERMERMSGRRNPTEISPDQMIVQGNLARLRMPAKKQQHEDVVGNYYWEINIARRRKKLTASHLANQIGTTAEIINTIEKGKLPQNFEEIFIKLEIILEIKLLKNHKAKPTFIKTKEEEEAIIRSVKEKITKGGRNIDYINEEDDDPIKDDLQTKINTEKQAEKQEKLNRITKGEMDMSIRKNLDNVTLNDLVEMKRQREKKEMQKKAKERVDSMVGEDIDLDIEEL